MMSESRRPLFKGEGEEEVGPVDLSGDLVEGCRGGP